MNENSSGALMGLDRRSKDSIAYLCFSACYDCPGTFEIIFTYSGRGEKRKEIGADSINRCFSNGCANLCEKFECYAFVLKMRNPQKKENMHATKYTYLTYVQYYKRLREDKWAFLGGGMINSYKNYRILQFNAIYDLAIK